jgi:hypothetical protein
MESKDAERLLSNLAVEKINKICSTTKLLVVLCMNTDTLEASTVYLLACKPRNIFRDKCLEEGRRGKKTDQFCAMNVWLNLQVLEMI